MNLYLQLMGIEVWHLRSSMSNDYYQYNLLDMQNRLIGVLLADAVLKDVKEIQLVEKIAKATKKQIRGGLKTGTLNPYALLHGVVILLGNQMVQLFAHVNYPRIVKSYSPAELLRNKHLKLRTWDVLKQAMWLMKS